MVVAYDTETTGLSRFHGGQIFAFSTCDEMGKTKVHRLDGSAVRIAQSKTALSTLWGEGHEDIEKTCHNIHFDLGHTESFYKKRLNKHKFHCTMLMSRILQNHHPSHALKDLAWELGGIPKDDQRAIKVYTKGGYSYQSVPENLMTAYQHKDAERAMLLFLFFYPKIQANNDWQEIYNNERDLIPVTIDMENRGVMLNLERCNKLITKLRTDADRVLDRIEYVTGERIKPGTDKHRWYLFEKLKLPILKRTAKTQQPCVQKEVLLEIRKTHPHPILDLSLEYISWARGVTTLESYIELSDDYGVLHPSINTCQAITGRQSCSTPNLQNVEKDHNLLNPYPVPARTAFRPRPGFVNFHLDYSGQEARLLIHYSGDRVLLKILNEGDGDTHSFVANLFYGERFKNADKKTRKELRDATKNGFFAISYGAAFMKVAATLGLTPAEGHRAWRVTRETLPNLIKFMPEIVRTIKNQGYIATAFGRYLHVPREQAYMGVNYLIQGTAAEMLKRGQVRVFDYLESATGGEMKMLLPIHDELIIECPRARLKDAKEILRHVAFLMTDFPGRFKVPMAVEVSVATLDWSKKSPYKLDDDKA